ncbi:hypothetical protein NPIL_150231 [Nephila pilipes]|uniref:Uncharacterized protein n=1 Tax=Nephila pilipes TaxID=299642 RepID=A0A8X6PXM4_NEPPI|nr:hypothetical protein NPIL_150231 [Nephila pilipes]
MSTEQRILASSLSPGASAVTLTVVTKLSYQCSNTFSAIQVKGFVRTVTSGCHSGIGRNGLIMSRLPDQLFELASAEKSVSISRQC